MRVKMSIKKMCQHCYFEKRRNNKLYVMCKMNPRHRQRQRFSTLLKSNLVAPSFTSPMTLFQRETIGQQLSKMLSDLMRF